MKFLNMLPTTILFLIGIFFFKELIVCNEETLIAICFILFVAFAYDMTHVSIQEEFKQKSLQIQKELDSYWNTRIEILNLFISFYKKQTEVHNQIPAMFLFSKNEMNSIIKKQQDAFSHHFYQQIGAKCQMIKNRKLQILNDIQQKAAFWFSLWAKIQYKYQINPELRTILFQQGIDQITNSSIHKS